MMAKIIDGNAVAREIRSECREQVLRRAVGLAAGIGGHRRRQRSGLASLRQK
jgi:hypothetical protein